MFYKENKSFSLPLGIPQHMALGLTVSNMVCKNRTGFRHFLNPVLPLLTFAKWSKAGERCGVHASESQVMEMCLFHVPAMGLSLLPGTQHIPAWPGPVANAPRTFRAQLLAKRASPGTNVDMKQQQSVVGLRVGSCLVRNRLWILWVRSAPSNLHLTHLISHSQNSCSFYWTYHPLTILENIQ